MDPVAVEEALDISLQPRYNLNRDPVAVEEALDISLQPRYNLNRDPVAVEEALDISLQPRYHHVAMLCLWFVSGANFYAICI
jgi:electron transfer flavoprotein alpha/beta subunit